MELKHVGTYIIIFFLNLNFFVHFLFCKCLLCQCVKNRLQELVVGMQYTNQNVKLKVIISKKCQ